MADDIRVIGTGSLMMISSFLAGRRRWKLKQEIWGDDAWIRHLETAQDCGISGQRRTP
jgi:hypothetical protein